MKFSMTGQERGGLIIDCMDNVDCILVVNNTWVCVVFTLFEYKVRSLVF